MSDFVYSMTIVAIKIIFALLASRRIGIAYERRDRASVSAAAFVTLLAIGALTR